MAAKTMSAGATGAVSNKPGLFERYFNVHPIRTLVKTLSMRPNPGLHGGGNRAIRMWMKWGFWIGVATFPTAVFMKYEYIPMAVNWFSNNDPRWKHAPSTMINHRDMRKLTWEPSMIMKEDPWSVYVDCYNAIPWEQCTKNDNPDEERGWNAFGTAVAGSGMSLTGPMGFMQDLQQRGRPPMVMYAQEDFTNYTTYFYKHAFAGIGKWAKDVYYNYYYVFWHVPLEERYESMGQSNGRRLMKRIWLGDGIAGYKNISWHEFLFSGVPAQTTFFG